MVYPSEYLKNILKGIPKCYRLRLSWSLARNKPESNITNAFPIRSLGGPVRSPQQPHSYSLACLIVEAAVLLRLTLHLPCPQLGVSLPSGYTYCREYGSILIDNPRKTRWSVSCEECVGGAGAKLGFAEYSFPLVFVPFFSTQSLSVDAGRQLNHREEAGRRLNRMRGRRKGGGRRMARWAC